ncbi:amidohydrolase [Mycolicibacterium duvalii]|uniref:Amidohydrolase n=1 Tax=Mycolicibacterium duvalii TaxID=39688 RepID=A0A7I7JY87_9MYCO|nr:amidohydrolase family protein [Mycolicibacterium duvalii]MCV7369564.1 amidohydrolase family protein [Mycolicibacterium duvalii]PEG42189.1 amidohydrolase [Mycolicibacterium duvalii]BBX16288.1 amidohydrolase [Mycolicibacterium duvalii]
MSYDLVIRGGTVIDGTGRPGYRGDVAITDGVITDVGRVDGRGRREIDADGALVTPGFVDIHTHYDGQVTWDSRLQPSSTHGVTTALMGNCGMGFAPVRPTDHAQLIELMEGVEDLPGPVLHEGLPWTWQSFEEYLDAVDGLPHDIDIAAQVTHDPLRLFVMGQRAADREAATPEDIAEMARLAAAGIRAGALGFSTSRTEWHKTSRGEQTPSVRAEINELVGIAKAIGETGTGVFQVVSDLKGFDHEVEVMYEMMRVSGRPLSLSVMQHEPGDGYRRTLHAIEQANAEGLHMTAVVAPRAIGVLVDFKGTYNPFVLSRLFRSGPDLRDPGVKRRILAEIAERGGLRAPLESIFELGDPPNYEPLPEESVAARAAREGKDAAEVLYDIMLNGPAYMPVFNYHGGNLDVVHEMLSHPNALPGLSDGGAHVATICDASFSTTLLTHWGRDRGRDRFDLTWLIQRQCRDTARMVGLTDRGVLGAGYKADVNVIDFDKLNARSPRLVSDLPAGGQRVLQAADGYLHTLVTGVEVYVSGEPTGALPGRLVRGRQTV